jgi:hypothetical protein
MIILCQGIIYPRVPDSTDMHGDLHRYMQQMDTQQALFNRQYQMRKDDAVCELLLCLQYCNLS